MKSRTKNTTLKNTIINERLEIMERRLLYMIKEMKTLRKLVMGVSTIHSFSGQMNYSHDPPVHSHQNPSRTRERKKKEKVV